MFWKSVVGKLAITILLLVSFVLFILTMLLMEFFENFHIQEAEKDMLQTATKVSIMVETYDDRSMMIDTVKRVKDPESRVVIVFDYNTDWTSDSSDQSLSSLDYNWIKHEDDLSDVLDENKDVKKQL